MPFDLQPHLVGQFVELRPLRPDEFDALYAVAGDPLIWEQHPEPDRWKPEVFQRYFDGAIASGGALVARNAQTGEIIGASRYCGYDEQASEIEIGWTFLARAYWGGKYNGEMKRLMLDHAFRFVDNVVFLVGPDNLRSQHAVQRIGGVRSGMRKDNCGGESVVFLITKGSWERIHL